MGLVKQPKMRRGFASMDPERVREIASMGGKKGGAASQGGRGENWKSSK